MSRSVAFLGSINVGGNRLLMVDLREALEREDFANVETVAASGNVLFDHVPTPSDGLAEKIAWILREEFAIDSLVVVKTRDELAAVIADNPFAASGNPANVHTMFLSEDPGAFQMKALTMDHAGRGNERIAAGPCALHIDYVDGVARSRLTGDFIARRLGIAGTARNMKSMTRILAKMEEPN